jgi:probable rRNA maturation factor
MGDSSGGPRGFKLQMGQPGWADWPGPQARGAQPDATMNADVRRSVYLGSWRIDVTTRPNVGAPLPTRRLGRAVAAALETARAPEPGSVAVILTDDEELADLNAAHMGHPGPTDVLSFPMLEPGAFKRSSGNRRRFSPTRRRTHIGDIAISVERAREQAEEGRGGQTGDIRWSVADELRLLVTHGALHLCGWDHAEPAEEAEMRALERRLLGVAEG